MKAAHRTASLFVDPRGNPRAGNLDTLVCKKGSSVHFKANEILGAIKAGKIPESMDNDAAAVPAFKIIPLDYLSTAAYWWMFDSSRALTDSEGLQFVESQPTTLDPVNVVYKFMHQLAVMLISKFRKFRENLILNQAILSQVL